MTDVARGPLACLLMSACALAACGGDDAPAQRTLTQAATPTPALTAATTATPSATATPAPKRTARAKPNATAKPAKPTATAPKATATPRPSAPMLCLTAARLADARQRSESLWSAEAPIGGQRVTVDGPYKSAKAAQQSAASLIAISVARVGGRYVVSAPLRAQAEPAVRKVARCLNERP